MNSAIVDLVHQLEQKLNRPNLQQLDWLMARASHCNKCAPSHDPADWANNVVVPRRRHIRALIPAIKTKTGKYPKTGALVAPTNPGAANSRKASS